MITIERITDISRPVQIDQLCGSEFTGEALAHTFRVAVVDGGEPVTLSGGLVSAYFLNASGQALELENGTISDGCAELTLPQACYGVPGRFLLTIFYTVTTDGTTDKTCIYAAAGSVTQSKSNPTYDPGDAVPDLSTLIQAASEAAADAQSALAQASAIVSYAAQTGQTAAEKTQARENIGAMGADDIRHVDGVEVAEWRRGYAITNNGSTVDVTAMNPSTTGFGCAVMDCSPGDVFVISGTGGSTVRLWCFITSTGAAIDPRAAASLTADKAIVIAPATAAKIVLNNKFTVNADAFAIKGYPISKRLDDVRIALGVDADANVVNFVPGYGIFTNGDTVDISSPTASTSGYAYAIADCSPGDVFTLTGKGGDGLRLWCFIDASGNALDPRAEASLTAYDLVVTAPASAAKLVVNSRLTQVPGTYLIKGRVIQKEIEANAADIAALQELGTYLPGADLLDGVTWTEGNYISYAGVVSTSDNLHCTDYIPVVGGRRCVVFAKFVSGSTTNVTTSIAAYDSGKNFLRRIGDITKNSGLAELSARLPADAAYVIISTGKATIVEKAMMFTQPSENWWPSRKWYALGDSITYGTVSTSASGSSRDPFRAYPVIAAKLLGYQLVNYAVPGMGFLQVAGMPPTGSPDNLPDVLAQSFTGAELVTVMLGTNDYGHDKTLGTIADTSATASVYGRIKLIVETMQTKCPTARLIFLTPIPRATAGSAATQYCKNAANGAGYTLDDVKDAIIESCEYYGIEYMNLQDTSPLNYANKGSFLLDNLHPSAAGHKRLGEWIASRIVF